jgi:hypothetical protein
VSGAETQWRVTIARIPSGQSLEMFSTLCGFFGAVLDGCQIAPGDGAGTAADVVNGEGVTERDVVVALRRATRKLAKGLPEPIAADEPHASDDPLTLNRMSKTEAGGVEFGIGGATEAAAEFAKHLIATFIPALEETNAVNYLSWDAVDPETRKRYSLIFVKPDGLTPHEARQQADAERDRAHASRQDWTDEAMRLDHLRERLVTAAKLPVDVDDELLVAEVEARFKGTVRAVVGHGAVRGQPRCECDEPMPTRRDWINHVEALRAQGVPTATITPAAKDGS